jgi:hypothetical protein
MFIFYNVPETGETDAMLSEAITKHFKPWGWLLNRFLFGN